MKNVRIGACIAAATVAWAGFGSTAAADEVRPAATGSIETIGGHLLESDIDPAVVAYFVDRLKSTREVQVVVSPDGTVSAPSITGGVIAPPPPPPIVRDVLRRVVRTVGIEGEVVVTVGRNGGEVSAPSITGGVIAPPPPPPIVRDLLGRVDEGIGERAVLVVRRAALLGAGEADFTAVSRTL